MVVPLIVVIIKLGLYLQPLLENIEPSVNKSLERV